MAFTYTTQIKSVFGNQKVRGGSWQNTPGTTGGTIGHSLKTVRKFELDTHGSSATAPAILNVATFPITSTSVTVVCIGTTIVGQWTAYGN